MACTAPGQDPPPRPMCLRSWETHQSGVLWPQLQVLWRGWGEGLLSNFLGTRSSLLGLSYNLYALAQGIDRIFLRGQMVNILTHGPYLCHNYSTLLSCCSMAQPDNT